MLLQQEQHVNKYHKSNNKNKFGKFRFKKKKSKPSRSPVMSFASNFQPPGTSDDRSFEMIGALLWCSVTTSTGKHFWVNPRGESRRSEPPKCSPNLHPLICPNMFSMQPWRNNFKCSTARIMTGLFSWRLM